MRDADYIKVERVQELLGLIFNTSSSRKFIQEKLESLWDKAFDEGCDYKQGEIDWGDRNRM